MRRNASPTAALRRVLAAATRAVLLFVAVAASPPAAAAQTRADTAAVLLDAARRMELEGDRAGAQALYRYVARLYAGTPAAEAVRVMATRLEEHGSPHAGRTELIVGGTLYGGWLGLAVPLALEANSPEAYGLGLLAGAPLGFLAARAYANAGPLSEGQARAITFGASWGTWQGAGWAQVLRLGVERAPCPWDPQELCEFGDNSTETVVSMIAGGLIGIGIGATMARRPVRAGTATAVSLGSGWGTVYGFGTAVLANIENDERATWALGLIGGNVGIITSALAAERMRLSRERARLISIAGVAGGLAGLGLDLLIQPDDERVAVAIPMATSALGLVLGTIWTRDHDSGRGIAPASPGDAPGALLRIDDGRFGVHIPGPQLLAIAGDRRGSLVPAAGVTLLHARTR